MKKQFIILFMILCLSCCKQNVITQTSTNTQQKDTIITLAIVSPEKPIFIEDGINLTRKKLVPDEETAFNIAIAVLSNIYGKKQLESESPFNVYLRDSIWVVYGTQKHQKGGFSYIEINSREGRVLKISHEE